ncbi:hypothetical protein BOTBODRAFT_408153 [Botryobasidium botryosum FD-172 SS1]|uniref:SH3 domain-containing protein n=1 Tax=Botryobasidium botryosum (strain FD-172 SS1) TaxID=930990 RepID=A0A067MDC8_BOTB1|nr:hypothetical protein BOTBODRAFT_408153 [Botryobasidium botryosum FD-172 SS1]
MVFANLSYEDKNAFFSLLDEYFESRPHLLGQGSSSASSAIPGGHATVAAVQRTMAANPQATGAIVTAGLKQMPKDSPYGAVASNPKVASGMGRVAAAAASLSASSAFPYGGAAGGGPQNANDRATSPSSPPAPAPRPTPSAKGPPPQPPVRRMPSSQSVSSTTERVTGSVKGFVAQGQGMLSSFRGNDSAPSAPSPPPAPPRSPAPAAVAPATRSSFAPPPVRRVAPAPKKEPEPEPEPEPEEEEVHGEWVEALYDYSSADANDLTIKTGQRILVTEHPSEEWWMGELDGRKGLFPASYVQAV